VARLRLQMAIALALLVLAALGLAAACGGGAQEATPTPTPTAPGQAELEIIMKDNSFEPNQLTVEAGQTITVKLENQGQNTHNMHIAGPDNEYDTGDDDFISEPDTFRAGQTGEIVFRIDQPGVYDFRCDFHATIMVGKITVQ
jgi:plastocyanin